jgi:hypothetical protein
MGPMTVSNPQRGGRPWQDELLLAIASCLVACGAESAGVSNTGANPSRDAGAVSARLDATQGPSLMIDAAAYASSVDGGQSSLPPPSGLPVPTCSPATTTLYPRPAEVLLVIDRSTTMAEAIATDGTSRWSATVAAVTGSVLASEETTAWGMMLFPKSSGDTACCQMPASDLAPLVEVAPDLGSTQVIAATLAQSTPTGIGTPTARALVQAANFLLARATSTSKYIVLVTGGDPTCVGDGLCDGASGSDYARSKETVAHVASVLGIPVAVAAVALPPATGNLQPSSRVQLFIDMANLGGMPNTAAGQPAYYAANGTADLVAALGALGAQATSCSFAVPIAVAWPDSAAVLMSENRIARDTTHQEGWDFGDSGASVVLFGKSCDDARSPNGHATLELVTACPATPVVALARRVRR